jgi:hypothetical protein
MEAREAQHQCADVAGRVPDGVVPGAPPRAVQASWQRGGRVHNGKARGGGRRHTRSGNGCWRRTDRGRGTGEKNKTFFPVINLISNYNCFI